MRKTTETPYKPAVSFVTTARPMINPIHIRIIEKYESVAPNALDKFQKHILAFKELFSF
jgi:hypothetical protein